MMDDYQVYPTEARAAKARLLLQLEGVSTSGGVGLRDTHGGQGDGYVIVVGVATEADLALVPKEVDGVRVEATVVGESIAF